MGSPSIEPRVAAAAMAMVTARTEVDPKFVAFSHTIVPIDINSNMRLEEVLKAASSVAETNTAEVFAVFKFSKFYFEISLICICT